ncbi:MAG TPA: TetR family transcriptional regulator [Candidatus Dormibacteraeota bacterium]
MAVTSKGEATRAAIFQAALDLFRVHGYEATTMRAIADRAGVSLGSSYHYYPSKEHLILELYSHLHVLHREACAPVLAREHSLAGRLRGVLRAIVMTCEPFHEVAGSLFSTVADPRSPLNPFGAESTAMRNQVIGLYAEVVRDSDARLAADVAAELPRLLWLYQMGVLYFWIMDGSPGRLQTLELIDETADLIVRLVSLANLPMLRQPRRRALALVRAIAGEPPDN